MKLIMEDDKKIEKAAYVLKAVAHPLRIKIIQMLHENKELNVSTIYKNLHAEQSLILPFVSAGPVSMSGPVPLGQRPYVFVACAVHW